MIEEGRRLQFVEEGRGGVSWGEALRGRLEHQRGRPHGNVVLRSLAGLFGHRIRKISGLEHIGIDRDPFVLALVLTSITLLIALFTNLLLLPSLLISFNKDEQIMPDGYINYEDEKEEVEAIRDFIGEEE